MAVERSALFWLASVLALCSCADVTANVRSRAARDFSCREDQTRVVDEESGVYRITGCGLEASYQCRENGTTLSTRCEQLYVAKLPTAPEKLGAGSSLAKER
jgi:hypothetical protein